MSCSLYFIHKTMIDTHAHLTDSKFTDDIEQILNKSFSNGIRAIITVATHIDDSRQCISLTKTHKNVFATVGVHPHEAQRWKPASASDIRTLSQECIAIGEIGLDYHYNFSPPTRQRDVFEHQLTLAAELEKPVVVHCRNAIGNLIEILLKFPPGIPGGVIHCYTGSYEEAVPLLNHGYYFSFGGMLTFQNANLIRETARRIPINRILLETDCPYLAPVPFRGSRNTPEYIKWIYESMASLKKCSLEHLIESVSKNVSECFHHIF
ncbi:TatD family hydrolase [bacterium]|nr:TatD family hydrolase [candidate division CSSED10-310 bacterium]